MLLYILKLLLLPPAVEFPFVEKLICALQSVEPLLAHQLCRSLRNETLQRVSRLHGTADERGRKAKEQVEGLWKLVKIQQFCGKRHAPQLFGRGKCLLQHDGPARHNQKPRLAGQHPLVL